MEWTIVYQRGDQDLGDSRTFVDNDLLKPQNPKPYKNLGKLTSATQKTVLYTVCLRLVPGALVTLLVLTLLPNEELSDPQHAIAKQVEQFAPGQDHAVSASQYGVTNSRILHV